MISQLLILSLHHIWTGVVFFILSPIFVSPCSKKSAAVKVMAALSFYIERTSMDVTKLKLI